MNSLAEYLCNKAIAVNAIESQEKDLYMYGFGLLISSIYTWGTFILLGLFFNSLLSAICFMLLFIPLRIFCGGFHRKSYFKCYTSSLFLFLYVYFISKVSFLEEVNLVLLMALPLAIWCIWKFAPLEDSNKPLDSCELIKYSKISKSILAVEVIIIFILWLYQINPLIIYFSVTAVDMIGLLLLLKIIQNLTRHNNYSTRP